MNTYKGRCKFCGVKFSSPTNNHYCSSKCDRLDTEFNFLLTGQIDKDFKELHGHITNNDEEFILIKLEKLRLGLLTPSDMVDIILYRDFLKKKRFKLNIERKKRYHG
ncbi:MAG: hypothetical protein K8E24_014460 [Methanobacterium paludis]|nr:hypothetical protein [Methanobacterium paludis]